MNLLSRWRFVLVLTLLLLPIVLIAGVGGWTLWMSGYWFWLSWVIVICWSVAWLVLRFTKRVEIPLPEIGTKIHWTPHDQAAATLIEAEENRVAEFSGEQLTDPKFYLERSTQLATQVSKHYHPKAPDPLGPVSVVELLAVVQLVAEDMEDLLIENVPGSHLITVSQWKLLSHAPAVWKTASNLGWIASILVNPASIARYGISRAFVNPLSEHLQTNLLGSFYKIFIRQLGFYLIELNSGRLRGGSARYRELRRKLKAADGAFKGSTTETVDTPEPVTVKIAVIGQVKAGKSSLVNCLLGEQRAAVDVLPLTQTVTRYQLQIDDKSDRLVLLDTPGYNDSGATPGQMNETREAVRDADLVLLVLDARSSSKKTDIETLDSLLTWFQSQNRLKPPPIVAVVSKIDGIKPVMEWSPPYDWQSPHRPKEKNIRSAMDYVKETFGDRLDSIIPVCTDRENSRVFGVEEFLLPTISLLLDEARAVSLVRSIHRDYDQQRAWQVVSQLASAGMKIREFAPEFAKSQFEKTARSILKAVTGK